MGQKHNVIAGAVKDSTGDLCRKHKAAFMKNEIVSAGLDIKKLKLACGRGCLLHALFHVRVPLFTPQ